MFGFHPTHWAQGRALKRAGLCPPLTQGELEAGKKPLDGLGSPTDSDELSRDGSGIVERVIPLYWHRSAPVLRSEGLEK